MSKLSIAIKTCWQYADRRQAQLDTWLKEVNSDFFFVIGGPEPTGDDFLYLRGLSDSFENIAPKVVGAVEYALQDNVTNLLVCDDDTYLSYARLLKLNFKRFDYLGFVRSYDVVPYMQGSCFMLNERGMERLLKHKDLMVNGVPDDVALGRCLYGEVPFTHEHRFAVGETYPEPNRWVRPENDIIACHKMTPAQMRACHELWK